MADTVNDKTDVFTIDDDCDISNDETVVLQQPSVPPTIAEPKESSIVLDDNDSQPKQHNPSPAKIPKLKPTTSKSRRKSAHKPVSDIDINLDSYVYVVSGGDSKQKKIKKQPTTLPENNEIISPASKDNESQEIHRAGIVKDKLKSQTNTIKKRRERIRKIPWTKAVDESNPNAELMKKVAFLRACVNYMMLRLDLKPFDFKDGTSMPMLMTTYYEQRNNQKNSGNNVPQHKPEGTEYLDVKLQ